MKQPIDKERSFWIAIRRCVIILLKAIEERYDLPSALRPKD